MKPLLSQIMKFGVVGGICFLIDYAIGIAIMNTILFFTSDRYFEVASLTGSIIGFTVSVVVNYLLSIRYVFDRKKDLDKKTEFIVFLILSIIGLLLNSLIIWLSVGPIYRNSLFMQRILGFNTMYTLAKVISTAIVMVYNFVSRKIFLEGKNVDD